MILNRLYNFNLACKNVKCGFDLQLLLDGVQSENNYSNPLIYKMKKLNKVISKIDTMYNSPIKTKKHTIELDKLIDENNALIKDFVFEITKIHRYYHILLKLFYVAENNLQNNINFLSYECSFFEILNTYENSNKCSFDSDFFEHLKCFNTLRNNLVHLSVEHIIKQLDVVAFEQLSSMFDSIYKKMAKIFRENEVFLVSIIEDEIVYVNKIIKLNNRRINERMVS